MRRLVPSLFVLSVACDPRVNGSDRQSVEIPSNTAVPISVPDSSGAPPPKPRITRCVNPTAKTPTRTFSGPIPAEGCPSDPGPKPVLGTQNLGFVGNKATVVAEVAKADADRQRGLMFRTSLEAGRGMLFEFERERELTFWMRNTCIPLDMIFVASDGFIVGIEENTPTLTDQGFSPGCNAKYVLEVPAGWSRANDIKAGDRMVFR